MKSEVFNIDCMEYMSQFPDNYFELAIVDPPYGIGIDGQKESKKGKKSDRKNHIKKGWDQSIPDEYYFNELFRVSQNQIIWGGNYFVRHLQKGTKGWIVWDKCQHGLSMSDCELAFTSFQTPTRIYKKNRVQLLIEGTIHPTQKPIHLYRWLLQNYAKPGDKILDTHLGSGSSRIAADMEGFDFYGCELDQDYFDQSCKRFNEYKLQTKLF
jgi:site-specific DNA-methyltransferase (adenine-specific)